MTGAVAQDEESGGRASRLRRAWVRSTVVATAGAILGGVAVFGAQYLFARINAGYPPFVQSIRCELDREGGALRPGAAPAVTVFGTGAALTGTPEDAGPMMLPSATVGSEISCRLDAPGADYAAWTLGGPSPEYRAGPHDPDLACQGQRAFVSQDARELRVSACQGFTLAQPGIHLLTVKVMARGIATVDRGQLAILVRPAPPPPVAAHRIVVSLVATPHTSVVERRRALSQTLSEHGVLPTDRHYARTVYRLAQGERFVDARFEPRSASHASDVRIAVDQGGAVVARFSLRSGPFLDRYRGWINGDVVTRVEVSEAGRTIDLPEAELTVPGRVTLPLPPDLDAAAIAQVRVRRAEGGAEGEGTLGVSFRVGRATAFARVTEAGLEIEATLP